MKRLVKGAIRSVVQRLPWGANEALFEGLVTRMGAAEIMARCAQRMDSIHLCANGGYGLIQSALNDGLLLPAYARSGTYEPRLAKLFQDFFARSHGGTYLDIGANIGLTTIPVAADSAVKCIAFEPEPVNNHNLRANIERNCPHHNVEIYDVALYRERTRLGLTLNQSNIGDHRIQTNAQADLVSVWVDAVPLDDFVDRIEGACAAKIDTQGAEPFIIAGGQRALAKASVVVLEFSPYHMSKLGSDPAIVLEFLGGFDRIAVGSSSGDDLPSPQPAGEAIASLQGWLATRRDGDQKYVDIFAYRGEGLPG